MAEFVRAPLAGNVTPSPASTISGSSDRRRRAVEAGRLDDGDEAAQTG